MEIKNFRNHQKFVADFDQTIIILEGNNGVGKTSILEAIFLASTTKSHRTNNDLELIKSGTQFASIKLTDETNFYNIVLSEKGKRVSINQIEKKKLSDYIGNLKTVFFAPEDLNLIKGTPSDRRYFLDLELIQLNPEYLKILSEYRKVIKQRNALLKKIRIDQDYTFLDILGKQLEQLSNQIMIFRQNFIDEINGLLLSNDVFVEIKYLPNSTIEQISNHFQTKQKHDILHQTTTVGIHKDDFIIKYNHQNAKIYCSQGQMRTAVILVKLALLSYIETKTKQSVVLLLDDVFSELDSEKQQLFIDKLTKKHQVFITSAVKLDFNNKEILKIKL